MAMENLTVSINTEYFHPAIIVSDNYREPELSIEQLYADYRDLIYHVALRVTHNAGDAEDVVQNVFLRMIQTDKQPDVGRCAVGYFRRAAMNAAIDLIRKRHSPSLWPN